MADGAFYKNKELRARTFELTQDLAGISAGYYRGSDLNYHVIAQQIAAFRFPKFALEAANRYHNGKQASQGIDTERNLQQIDTVRPIMEFGYEHYKRFGPKN